jgi:toxin ParE1/3/4
VGLLRVSSEAESDLDLIVAYTIDTWGTDQADQYLAQLENGFDLLAGNPSLGRSCDVLHAGLRRFEVESHVVFYLTEPDGILVVRVLHRSMLPARHF